MEIGLTWWEYAIFDDESGTLCGISENAPEEEKKKFDEYMQRKKGYIERGERMPK